MILMKKLCYVSFSIFAFVLIYFVNDVSVVIKKS